MKGERQDAHGWQVFVRVRGKFRSKRLKPNATPTQRREARNELRARAELQVVPIRDAAPAATFRADADEYLKLITHMPAFQDRAFEIERWAHAFAGRTRASITQRDIRAVLERWRVNGRADGKGGLSVSSLNRRRTSLMSLYTTLDGKSAVNPVRDVPAYSEHHNEVDHSHPPRLLYRLIARVGSFFDRDQRPSKTQARLRVMLHTGWPQKILGQVRESDINWTKGKETARLHARRKGKGHPPVTVVLLPGAVAALRHFFDIGAQGPFSTSGMCKSLKRAEDAENAHRARLGLPPIAHVRSYDMRHVFCCELAKRVNDQSALQAMMLHGTPQQTIRYMRGAQIDKLEALRRSVAGGK
jgi:hypothetical protein